MLNTTLLEEFSEGYFFMSGKILGVSRRLGNVERALVFNADGR
jgi:hypothetical protein